MAMVALVFSEYLFMDVLPDQDVLTWILKGTALLAIALITYISCILAKRHTSVISALGPKKKAIGHTRRL